MHEPSVNPVTSTELLRGASALFNAEDALTLLAPMSVARRFTNALCSWHAVHLETTNRHNSARGAVSVYCEYDRRRSARKHLVILEEYRVLITATDCSLNER